MSQQPINLSPDLTRLRDDGYEIEIIGAYLVIRSVPYANSKKEVRRGTLVSELTLAGDVTVPPKTHVALFAGEYPCDQNGVPLEKIKHSSDRKEIGGGLFTDFSFSSKPANGYADFYDKMTTYVALLSSHAEALDKNTTARTWRVIELDDPEFVFHYLDAATSRAGTTTLSRKLELAKIAIVGCGGTGSYILDFAAKTPVKEIHVFDGDRFLQHNAFRAPGAPSIDQLKTIPHKVHYLAAIYSRMRKSIIPHDVNIDASNVELLRGFDFVFLSMDAGVAKKIIIEKLEEFGIPFIDVGMGLEIVDDKLTGMVRVTSSIPGKRDHVRAKDRIPLKGEGQENLYATNIQIAELNAFNAALAIMKWKKLYGFYADTENEYFSVYALDGNTIINDDQA